MNGAPTRLFLRLVHAWVLLFVLSLLPAFEFLWDVPVSPHLPASGLVAHFNQAFDTWLPGGAVGPVIAVLLMVCAWNLLAPHWLRSVMVWALFTSLMDRAWLVGSGGQQLMSILLFWCIFLTFRNERSPWQQGLFLFAFWAARLQLLLVYAATAAHKWTGSTWPEGTAVGIVATDPAYGLAWIAAFPLFCKLLTWGLLAFMTLFPVAVWWSPSRRVLLFIGAVFHLSTAVFMDIPEMGAAFVIAYALWLSPSEADLFLHLRSTGRKAQHAA